MPQRIFPEHRRCRLHGEQENQQPGEAETAPKARLETGPGSAVRAAREEEPPEEEEREAQEHGGGWCVPRNWNYLELHMQLQKQKQGEATKVGRNCEK